ncbi:MAG: carbohydrate-binding domain-containing protein [Myxococcota bacterium]
MREMDGESLLLLKPRGELSHGGGPVVPEGTESYDALVELVDRLANPRSCDGMSTDRDTGVSMDTSQPPMDTAMAEEDIAPDLPSQPESQEWLFEGEGNDVQATTGQASNNGYNLWSNGELTATVEVPADGTYTIRARVWGQQCCDGLARMALLLDGQRVLEHDVTAENASQAELVEHQMQLTAARHTIGVEFLNDFFDQPSGQDRNLLVDWISLEGPNP